MLSDPTSPSVDNIRVIETDKTSSVKQVKGGVQAALITSVDLDQPVQAFRTRILIIGRLVRLQSDHGYCLTGWMKSVWTITQIKNRSAGSAALSAQPRLLSVMYPSTTTHQALNTVPYASESFQLFIQATLNEEEPGEDLHTKG